MNGKNKYKLIHLFYILIFITNLIYSQEKNNKCYTILFYNVENYFDTFDDIHVNDNEFLPLSPKKWDEKKFNKKTINLYKLIASIDIDPPAIIGMAEVENRYVLEKLFYSTPLQKYPYKIIHENSPDKRGIDVAMIYRSDISKNLFYKYIKIHFPLYPNSFTRDILLATQLFNNDTIFIFIVHLPSRIGGTESEYKRNYVAKVLSYNVDSLLKINPLRKILIMGDFNDEPCNISLTDILKAGCKNIKSNNTYKLLNTMCLKNYKIGTIKYKGNWYIFDQIIISKELFNSSINSKKYTETIIYSPEFLLIPDSKYGGVKPFSTYEGKKYIGGFSDHLPVLIKFCN